MNGGEGVTDEEQDELADQGWKEYKAKMEDEACERYEAEMRAPKICVSCGKEFTRKVGLGLLDWQHKKTCSKFCYIRDYNIALLLGDIAKKAKPKPPVVQKHIPPCRLCGQPSEQDYLCFSHLQKLRVTGTASYFGNY